MSLRNSPYLCQVIDARRPWNAEIEARYDELSATTFATTPATTDVKSICQRSFLSVAHSSSGLGHRPLKAEITGSNPVCATTKFETPADSGARAFQIAPSVLSLRPRVQ